MSFKELYLNKKVGLYFIAEIGINHNGVFELAKRMIDASKEAGADAVKFQKRNIETLVLEGVEIPEPTGYLSKDETDFPSESRAFGTWTYPDKRLEFSDEQFMQLWQYTESIGLDYIVSPWEESSVDFLQENKAKVIKLASIDNTNYQFCEYVASKEIPTIVSTGMANYQQLNIVKEIFDRASCPFVFLHCTSAYPSPIEDKNLKCIPIMNDMYGMEVGFSGHAIGVEGTLAAVSLGVKIIEKHVTLSRKMSGPDHAASLEFHELSELIEKANNVVKALGHGRKEFLQSEKVLHGVLAKRIVTSVPISSGTVITSEMIKTVVTKQSGGMLPDQFFSVVGSKATKDLDRNHILIPADLSID